MVDYHQSYSGTSMVTSESHGSSSITAKPRHPGYSSYPSNNPASPDTPESLSEAATFHDYNSFPPTSTMQHHIGTNPSMNYMMPQGFNYPIRQSQEPTSHSNYTSLENPNENNFDSLYHPPGYDSSGYALPFISSPSNGINHEAFMEPPSFGMHGFNAPLPFMRLGEEDNNEIRGRAENWHYAETKQFVQILLAHRQELSDLRRHPGVWETVAAELQAYGYDRSVDKCKNRWKVLVAKYKKYTEKTLKGKNPRGPTPSPMNPMGMNMTLPKLPGFMQNGDYHPSLSINYHYYHSHRLSNPHGGTGGFEFYAEMHQLLSHIYSHGPDGVIKRRTPQAMPQSMPPASSPPMSQLQSLPSQAHSMDPNLHSSNSSMMDPNISRSFLPFRTDNNSP